MAAELKEPLLPPKPSSSSPHMGTAGGVAGGRRPLFQGMDLLGLKKRGQGIRSWIRVDAATGTSQKDKGSRRRLGLENRLRDERVGRREPDRYDRSGNSPSRDLSGSAGQEEGTGDDSMYDAYGVPPFPSDIPPPPPVLMPVPGAGPLGPFVPAPPEVAMRMLREQGGPSPFDPNGGPRGRKGRPGPPVGPSAPIFAPPAFRQDPRRMRSYHDLDAPEDEVTVIDYRSL